jgi:molybdopterin/thiamine biosynthesis adenylyltransferase
VEHTRQSGIFNASRLSVTVIGVGGIGALTALVLAKMGVGYITLFDDDIVNTVNLATQMFRVYDVEKYKVDAVIDQIHDYTDDVEVVGYSERVSPLILDPPVALGGLVISAVDSIIARQEIWEVISPWYGFTWYIDARMASESFQAYIVRRNQMDWYDTLIRSQKDDDIPDEPCTSRATFYTAALAAAHIGNIVRKIITGQPLPKRIVQDLVSNTLLVI